jgi:hypothetical protein
VQWNAQAIQQSRHELSPVSDGAPIEGAQP